MPTVRIDDKVWSELQRRATAFVDTPNDVLRRLLDIPKAALVGSDPQAKNSRRGQLHALPDNAYRIPILETLVELGGSAPTGEVLKWVESMVKDQLTEDDYEPLEKSRELRWRNRAKFERKHMVDEVPPLLSPTSRRGVWEITDEGRRALTAGS